MSAEQRHFTDNGIHRRRREKANRAARQRGGRRFCERDHVGAADDQTTRAHNDAMTSLAATVSKCFRVAHCVQIRRHP